MNLDKNIPPYVQISSAGILSRHNAVTTLTKQYSFQLSQTIVRWENICIKWGMSFFFPVSEIFAFSS